MCRNDRGTCPVANLGWGNRDPSRNESRVLHPIVTIITGPRPNPQDLLSKHPCCERALVLSTSGHGVLIGERPQISRWQGTWQLGGSKTIACDYFKCSDRLEHTTYSLIQLRFSKCAVTWPDHPMTRCDDFYLHHCRQWLITEEMCLG